jgi:nucleotide-binding universal stress UspA family protein
MTTRLFDSVIIGFDGSKQSEDALALGRLLGSIGESGIVLAYITDHQPPFERQRRTYAQARRERVHEVLEPALSALAGRDRVEPASIDSSSPARGLHDLASEYCKYGAGVLAIGSTHRGPIGRVVVGSVGEQLISGCPCPITVAPKGFARDAPESIARIAVGFDGSPESRDALAVAHDLARATGAEIHVVSVAHSSALAKRDHGDAQARDREELQARLDEALAQLGGNASGTVVDGDPAERLAEAAVDADLLVVGARGYGPHQHVFVGSVSSKVVRTSPCPVLVLPRPAPDESDDPSA